MNTKAINFAYLVDLVSLDQAIRFYELREELGIDRFMDEKGVATEDIDLASAIINGDVSLR